MSTILYLSENLRRTGEAIAIHEQAIAKKPSPSLEASLRSLVKRMRELETEFQFLAAHQSVDVCRYKFIPEQNNASCLKPVCNVLLAFQNMYTLAYDAVKNGVKQIARLTDETVQESSFDFGYTFSGSLGVTLTFENRKVDLFASYMDEAMSKVFEMFHAENISSLEKIGAELGTPVIRAAHTLAREHIKANLAAEIAWVRASEVKNHTAMELADFVKLEELLSSSSSTRTEVLSIEGEFVGTESLTKQQFHFLGDDGQEYRGTFTDAISKENPVKVPARYIAVIRKTEKVFFTSERDDSSTYFLEKLLPISGKNNPK